MGKKLVECSKMKNPQECKFLTDPAFNDNIYSLYQLDSFGKLPGDILGMNKIWMGDYDECMDVGNPKDPDYKTQFCWAHLNVPLGSVLKSKTPTKSVGSTCGEGKPADIKTNVCMPRSCSENDLLAILNNIPHKLAMKGFKSVCEVTCRPTSFNFDLPFWCMTIVLTIVLSLCVSATLFDQYIQKRFGEAHPKKLRYWLAFSFLTNGQNLLRTSRNPNVLKGVECIRFLSFTWVVSGHLWGYFGFADNPLAVVDIFSSIEYEVWINAFFSVDTFFFLSGLMLAYSFLPKLTLRKAMNPNTWLIFYVHRFLRLTPAYISFIFFYATYGLLSDFGPNGLSKVQDMKNCRTLWWKNILYVNNLIEPRRTCLSVTWYMATDTQMYLLSPLFLIPFLFGTTFGFLAILIGLVLSTAITYYLFFRYDLPPTLLRVYMTGNIELIHQLQDFVYAASYVRIPPFLIGIGMGYVMWKTRNVKIRMNLVMNGPHFKEQPTTRLADYYGPLVYRGSFSLSIVDNQIILIGLIGKFMSLNFWNPLGKLAFCGYLCHIMIIGTFLNMQKAPLHFSGAFQTYFSNLVPIVFMTTLFALFWSLMFEMPFARLEGYFLQQLMGVPRRNEKDEKQIVECTKI
ncbi:unnamed protein product [Caenorhabditis bovis]|uniref:Nose resistant-to-fluoxetine protein N-terminal domain-containing protein n=1 Tax=Caenorhabditis bovis TaxID=2654633 RepID=A0A8S1F6P8_9PELO|nr:unnamed protein product [Caenorhabditis bovis]